MGLVNISLKDYLSDVQPTDYWTVRWGLFADDSRNEQGERKATRRYDHDTIRRMHDEGLSSSEVAAVLGCTDSLVQKVLRIDRLKQEREQR